MANVIPGYNWTSGETVTPTKLNAAASPAVALADGEVTDAKIASGIDASKITIGTLPIARIADGQVTLAKLVTAVQEALLPAGAVQAFAMNNAPSGWLAANGSNVSRSTYAALFTAIGTTYGAGDGSTTFALPDLRGYFVRGSGTNGDGTAAGTFAAKQADAFQAHRHGITSGSFYYVGSGSLGASGGSAIPAQTIAVGDATVSGANGTPRTATETRPKNIAMLYCIKF
jgi:microcystin-dependent protein